MPERESLCRYQRPWSVLLSGASLVAERAIRNLSSPTISDLTLVEFASAISRKGPGKDVASRKCLKSHGSIRGGCRGLVHGYYEVLSLKTRDYRLAKSWLGPLNGTLRTLDALHLAVAEATGTSIVTADRRLASEARRLGVSVKLLTMGRAL